MNGTKMHVERIGTARRIELTKRGRRGRFAHDFGRNVPVYTAGGGKFLIIGGRLRITNGEIRG